MNPQILTFENYSPARWAALQAVLLEKGLNISGVMGDIKKFGADVSYVYGSNAITLVVRSAPHFHNLPTFCAELSDEINAVPVQ